MPLMSTTISKLSSLQDMGSEETDGTGDNNEMKGVTTPPTDTDEEGSAKESRSRGTSFTNLILGQTNEM